MQFLAVTGLLLIFLKFIGLGMPWVYVLIPLYPIIFLSLFYFVMYLWGRSLEEADRATPRK